MTEMNDKPRIAFTPSAIALITANALPIFGVIWLDWDVYPVILLYWLENGVIGLFTILRLLFSRSPEPHKLSMKLLGTPFFCIHYGGFWIGHGLFVLVAFGPLKSHGIPTLQMLGVTALDAIRVNALWFALVGLAVSHAYSFIWNFLLKGEQNKAYIVELQEAPYSRVVVLHVFIILGGFLMMQLHSPVLGMITLTILKTVFDLWSHSKERQRLESKRHKYFEMKYARVETPCEPNKLDSLQEILPDYSRDFVDEKRHLSRAGKLLWTGVLLVPIGIIALMTHSTLVAICLFGLSVVFPVMSIVMYNFPSRVRCSKCNTCMETMLTDATPQDSPNMQRGISARGVKQKWLVCHHCKRYYFCVLQYPKETSRHPKEAAKRW
jgi:hypothetical protein